MFLEIEVLRVTEVGDIVVQVGVVWLEDVISFVIQQRYIVHVVVEISIRGSRYVIGGVDPLEQAVLILLLLGMVLRGLLGLLCLL